MSKNLTQKQTGKVAQKLVKQGFNGPTPKQKIAQKKKRQNKRVAAVKKTNLPPTIISNVDNLTPADGVSKAIVIQTVIDQPSFNFIPVGLVSFALNRGFQLPYSFYRGIYDDILSIATGGSGTATTRLKFMNEIYMALSPKSVPFRLQGMVSYKFTEFPSSPPPAVLNLDGGLNYYMYIESNTNLGLWRRQVAPPGPSTEEIADAYNDAIALLAGRVPHNKVVRNVELGTHYKYDASAYARGSIYYGTGAGEGSPNKSIELEVPFKSNLLGTLQQFSPGTNRSSRVFAYSSGDSISNWSIGYMEKFLTSYYDGAVTPFYKFLDLTEVVHSLITAYVQAVTLFVSSMPNITTELAAMLSSGLGCTYTQYYIMVRQQLLYMFNDSQAMGQGQTFSGLPGGFRPFLASSNTYGRQPNEKILVPFVLNENLRGLRLAIRPYDTIKYPSKRNHITHIPVWGTFSGMVPLQYNLNVNGNPFPVFLPEITDPNTPNVFDGTALGQAVDFNNSGIISQTASIWNENMRALSNQYAGLTSLGGDATNGPFLQFTRYCNFVTINEDVTGRRRIPAHWRNYIEEVCEEETLPVMTKKNSKSNLKEKKIVYAPPNSTILSEFTVSYSGMVPITATHKEYFGSLILPIIEVPGPASIPSITQVQIATTEPFLLDLNGVASPNNNRGDEIITATANYLTGLSGKKSELAEFVTKMSNMNEGGFLGDLFAAISPIADVFPGAQIITKGVGGILQATGL